MTIADRTEPVTLVVAGRQPLPTSVMRMGIRGASLRLPRPTRHLILSQMVGRIQFRAPK